MRKINNKICGVPEKNMGGRVGVNMQGRSRGEIQKSNEIALISCFLGLFQLRSQQVT